MNAENFADYLKDYSKLYQLPYEELKSLVLQYPYCSNLHYLLVEKSQLDQNRELEQNIQKASFYSPDRAALRRLLLQLKVVARQMESFELAEDYLELKDLTTIQQEVEPLIADDFFNADQEDTQSIPELFSSLTDFSEDSDELLTDPVEEEEQSLSDDSFPEQETDPTVEEKYPEPSPEKAGESLEELFEQLMSESPSTVMEDILPATDVKEEVSEAPSEGSDSSPILQDESNNEPEGPSVTAPPETNTGEKTNKSDDDMEISKDPVNQPQPTPKTSFTSWVQQFQPTHVKVQLGELMESKKREDAKQDRKKKKKKKKKKDKVILFAERSLQERKDLASETLAELLIAQEQYDKAIEMYKRLILKFPEKSSYFADKIKNLKNQ